ncbi:hypothetical protein ADUPG1_007217 [Aduncisulcus paluster]|uniref:Uncharacterized protein n=1 Tax=Aduncisulcus paluster TaxID=2918883 RepID=A0ABQ5KL73_9EUKA|nr:hypothetical protein ADUPG1_007217 [Aduncisulcus paluster]
MEISISSPEDSKEISEKTARPILHLEEEKEPLFITKVHLQDSTLVIQIDDEEDKSWPTVEWCCWAALVRYDKQFGIKAGAPIRVYRENGDDVPLDAAVRKVLKNGEDITLIVSNTYYAA